MAASDYMAIGGGISNHDNMAGRGRRGQQRGNSRFIKEKKLDARDVVLIECVRASGDRLYIGCRCQGGEEGPPGNRGGSDEGYEQKLTIVWGGRWSSEGTLVVQGWKQGAMVTWLCGYAEKDGEAAAAGKSGRRRPTAGVSGEGGGRVAARSSCSSDSGRGGRGRQQHGEEDGRMGAAVVEEGAAMVNAKVAAAVWQQRGLW
ncbi:hypothetical protein B296_00009355 [Ensete ventricosum]|uniref:Uncharacterized protein n=1 Tax=Ensete ventricosum TaxID=4639 RepID=A0A427AXS7_ENSVE|nr:hypothetical protein B296_00009355 [Ensete ventricosum]